MRAKQEIKEDITRKDVICEYSPAIGTLARTDAILEVLFDIRDLLDKPVVPMGGGGYVGTALTPQCYRCLGVGGAGTQYDCGRHSGGAGGVF